MKEERWKKEFATYKKCLSTLKTALDYAGCKQDDPKLACLLSYGLMQAFVSAVHCAAAVMNEYMQSQGQGRNKSLKNIFSKALKMGVISYRRWLDADAELEAISRVADETEALKFAKKIRRIYLPMMERFAAVMELKGQPTLFG